MGAPERDLKDITKGMKQKDKSVGFLSSLNFSHTAGSTHDAIVARGGVWKTPFVLTGSSTPPGNGMTFDGLRHQLSPPYIMNSYTSLKSKNCGRADCSELAGAIKQCEKPFDPRKYISERHSLE